MSDNILLRPVRIEDATAIDCLLNQLGYPGTILFLPDRIEAILMDAMAACWIAEKAGEVVGVISMNQIPQLALAGDFARVSYFCIDIQSRGMAIGQTLIQKAEAWARERRCDRIEVHCHERRTSAHRFYQREGFIESPKYFIKML